MKIEKEASSRSLKQVSIHANLAVVGGGLAGTCTAIAAAREGLKVVLLQDRPVLGGNSSSEVRLWVLGATSHMGNNNRWARESGIIDEILTENLYRNREGNPLIFDTILLEWVTKEKNITLLLNTAVYDLQKKNEGDQIESLNAFCSQNSTMYVIHASLFSDCSGDGIVAFLAGAAFRMGAESKEEFGEKFAPTIEYGELLGHSIYFYTKDTSRPVKYTPPSFALTDIEKNIPRFRSFNTKEYGCRLWWIEYGGRLDTVHDTETIKWELWKVVYGVWDYIKNSGKFPEADTLTLEWVGHIPGKRESRRFEGDYMLCQQDLIEQRPFEDAVAFGGWSIDLHPADGVFSEKSGCNQWHSKGIYPIPYRCLYSRNVSNLFIAGRTMSSSHVAFGSTRVMGTSAYCGQAVGIAAALCYKNNVLPKELAAGKLLKDLQILLQRSGQFLPGIEMKNSFDLAQEADVSVSSELELIELPSDGPWEKLDFSAAQMLPLSSGKVPEMELEILAEEDTVLEVELRKSLKVQNHTPEHKLISKKINLKKGENKITLDFSIEVKYTQYYFYCLMKNEKVSVKTSQQRLTGILTVYNRFNKAVSNYGRQDPSEDIGVDAFEFWTPKRRPEGLNFAFRLDKKIKIFGKENVLNGINRPVQSVNAWLADFKDKNPEIKFSWKNKKTVREIILEFDGDFDHPMESVLMGHPENIIPFCVKDYQLLNEKGDVVFEKYGNYQPRNILQFEKHLELEQLSLRILSVNGPCPAAVFAVKIF